MLRLVTHIITVNNTQSAALPGGFHAVHTNVIETVCEDYDEVEKVTARINQELGVGIGAASPGQPYTVSVHCRHVVLPLFGEHNIKRL